MLTSIHPCQHMDLTVMGSLQESLELMLVLTSQSPFHLASWNKTYPQNNIGNAAPASKQDIDTNNITKRILTFKSNLGMQSPLLPPTPQKRNQEH